MSYKVKLDIFEGPLDLLLHLINRLEIDIYDIPMAELTEQYLAHVHAMRVLQLDELSEYLVLAATLIEIKSKTLLPVHEDDSFEDDFEFDEEDPREELVARLLEYRKYKEAAVDLQQYAEERSQHYSKAPEDLSKFGEIKMVESDEVLNAFDLIGAFQKLLERNRLKAPMTANITRTEVTVAETMDSLLTTLRSQKGRCSFENLFDRGDTSVLVVTFLAVLELMLRGDIFVEQEQNFATLTIVLGEEGV